MSRRYHKAVEQYLATHTPTTLRSEFDKQRLIREHAQRVAKHVEEASQDLTMSRFGRPTRELRNELERVVFPYAMTSSVPPERERMHGLGDADANFIMLSDSLRNARTPMGLRTEAAYAKFEWDNDRPVFRVDGSVAATWEDVLEDHQRQADAVNTLRSLNGRQLAIVDRMIRADRVPEGVAPTSGTVGEASWADVAHLVDRERAAGSFEIPTGPPHAPTGLELDPYSAAGMRYELQVELYRHANPPSEAEQAALLIDRSATGALRPMIRTSVGEPTILRELPLRPADIHAQASTGPSTPRGVEGPSL